MGMPKAVLEGLQEKDWILHAISQMAFLVLCSIIESNKSGAHMPRNKVTTSLGPEAPKSGFDDSPEHPNSSTPCFPNSECKVYPMYRYERLAAHYFPSIQNVRQMIDLPSVNQCWSK